MKNTLLSIMVLAIFFITARTVPAVIIYDEGVNGDLDAIGTENVDLVLGLNTISGVINQTPPAETDRIKFTQTAGLKIDSISLSFAAPFDDANIGQSMNTALFNNVANLYDDSFNTVNFGDTIVASFFDSFVQKQGT